MTMLCCLAGEPNYIGNGVLLSTCQAASELLQPSGTLIVFDLLLTNHQLRLLPKLDGTNLFRCPETIPSRFNYTPFPDASLKRLCMDRRVTFLSFTLQRTAYYPLSTGLVVENAYILLQILEGAYSGDRPSLFCAFLNNMYSYHITGFLDLIVNSFGI